MKEIFLQSIRDEYPNEQVTRLVFADWCMENEPELEEKLRKHFPPIDRLRIYKKCEFGDGNKFGVAYDVYCMENFGFGLGYGDGEGDGFGKGYGSDASEGYCCGFDYVEFELKMPKLNQNQLLFLPFGCVFCGYVSEQIDTYIFKITSAFMIVDHHSSWHEIANNTNRNIQTRKFGTITIGPQIFTSMDWEGDLP